MLLGRAATAARGPTATGLRLALHLGIQLVQAQPPIPGNRIAGLATPGKLKVTKAPSSHLDTEECALQ